MVRNNHIEHYENAKNYLLQNLNQPITEELILKTHALVMGSTTIIGFRTGTGSPVIKNEKTKEERYWAPIGLTTCIKTEISNIITQFYKLEVDSCHAAAQLHWWIVKLHPFLDGNGRTARLLALFILINNGYQNLDPLAFEEYVQQHRNEYDDSLDDGVFVGSSKPTKVSGKFILFITKCIDTTTQNTSRNCNNSKLQNLIP